MEDGQENPPLNASPLRTERADCWDLRVRTKRFALTVIRLYTLLPQTQLANTLGGQFLRSGTSVGAHYREATRARSTAEFVSKMAGGLQELEETSYWFELVSEAKILPSKEISPAHREANELTAIFVASITTAKKR